GQTGQSVAAGLYIAFGISGAIQHLCGIKNCKKIIAVNNDKNAPIFNHCDIGIVDDAALVIEQLKNLLSQKV
ncbi:MAG: FAD-binding protein, partial [Candidatus Gastranaerophilales bacterium]|nr:FAD-binding protein [Candidatus Gastranaerophilales bacterium]